MSSPCSYRLLPDHVRDADTSHQLEAFLNGVEDALGPELWFLDAADPHTGVPGVSQPVHPDYTPAGWLPWLASLIGADIRGLSDEQARWYLSRRGRTAVGSTAGIKDAVAATLTGTRYVRVDRPSLWTMTVTVATDEIVDVVVTTQAAQRSKPAGVNITLAPLEPVSLAELDAAYASLAAMYATGKNLDQLRFG